MVKEPIEQTVTPLLILSPQKVYNPPDPHNPNNPHNLHTLTAHAHRKNTLTVYKSANAKNKITNCFINQIRRSEAQQQRRHHTNQNPVIQRNKNPTLINNHFNQNYKRQHRQRPNHHNNTQITQIGAPKYQRHPCGK